MTDYRSTDSGNFFLLAAGAAAGLLASCSGGVSAPATPPAETPLLAYSESTFVYLTDVIAPTIEPLEEPAGTTGYTVAPALPAGLALDPVTGAITGTPTAVAPPTEYTLTAAGADLSTTVELEVRDAFGPPRFAFALDWGGARIDTLRVDGETGDLVATESSTADQFPFRGATDPLGRFLYVAHFGTGNLGVYAIDQETGALTIVQLLQLGSATIDVAVSADGRFLYAADLGLDVVALFEIEPTSGLLVPTTTLLPIDDPSGLALSPDGASLFVASLSGNLVASFALDPATGAFLAARGTTNTPGPFDLALTPDGTALYTCNFGVDAVTGLSIDPSGQLDRIDSWDVPVDPVGVSLDPTGARLTVASFGGEALTSFEVLVDKTIVERARLDNLGQMAAVAELGVGERVMAASFDRGLAVVALPSVDPGALLDGAREAVGGHPVDLIPVRTARPASLIPDDVYSANISAGDVAALDFDAILEQLAPLAAPAAAGAKPSDVALAPDGRFLYVAEELSGDVLTFRRDLANGSLSKQIFAAQAGFLVRALAVSPDGERLVAVGNAGVTYFDVDVETGALTALGTVNAGLAPDDVALDPTGRFVFVANRNSGDISVFDALSGSLIEIPGSAFDNGLTSGPRALALSPDGRLLAVASSNLNQVRVHRVNPSTGALTFEQDLIVGLDPRDLAWSLDGRTLYAALVDENAVAVVRRDESDVLSLVTTHTAGLDTLAVDVDPSGELLYAAAFASSTVEVFRIDALGALTHIDSAPLGALAGPDALASRADWADL